LLHQSFIFIKGVLVHKIGSWCKSYNRHLYFILAAPYEPCVCSFKGRLHVFTVRIVQLFHFSLSSKSCMSIVTPTLYLHFQVTYLSTLDSRAQLITELLLPMSKNRLVHLNVSTGYFSQLIDSFCHNKLIILTHNGVDFTKSP